MSDDSQTVMKRLTITIVFVFLELMGGMALAADPPCDTYPAAKQPRCSEIWKDLYKEGRPGHRTVWAGPTEASRGSQITAEQHLAQNMDFIKQSTEKRLARLKARMAKE